MPLGVHPGISELYGAAVMMTSTETNEPNYADIRPSIVSVLDILGYSKIVKDEKKSPELFRAVADAIKEAEEKVGKMTSRVKKPGSLACHAFSDNIIVSCGYYPGTNDPEKCWDNTVAISMVLMIQASIQTHLISKYGLLSRGGTVLGDYYEDEDKKFIFGPAIVDAYELEQYATTPRMVVDGNVINLYVQSAKDAGLPMDADSLGRLFVPDYDGETYVHYLLTCAFIEGILSGGVRAQSDLSLLQDHRNGLLKAIAENKKDIVSNRRIRAKYKWAVDYHNMVVELSNFGEPIGFEALFNSICYDTDRPHVDS